MSSCRSKPRKVIPARLWPTPMPIAPFSSCTHIAITARSKRGSAMPGIASNSLLERNAGSSTTRRQWSADPQPTSLETAAGRAYLPPQPLREEYSPMTIQVGERLPDVPLSVAGPDGPQPTTSGEYFQGKRVALFAVPGAFTPTCSARHLPSYVDKAGELKGKGVDEIACISVNDPFVMSAWNQRDGSEGITMLADGNGDFEEASGRTMDGRNFGMGKRSQRYSRSVNDGVLEQLNVGAPGEYGASSAEHMLHESATA